MQPSRVVEEASYELLARFSCPPALTFCGDCRFDKKIGFSDVTSTAAIFSRWYYQLLHKVAALLRDFLEEFASRQAELCMLCGGRRGLSIPLASGSRCSSSPSNFGAEAPLS